MRWMMWVVPVLMAVMAAGTAEARSYERDTDRAIRACVDGLLRQERREGKVFGQPVEVRNGRGERVGEDVPLQVSRPSGVLVCRYDYATGRVTFDATPWGAGKDKDRDRAPSLSVTREACERAVERRDYRNLRVRSQADVLDNRRRAVARLVAIDARRDGRDWRVNCTYQFRNKDITLEVFRR
jgi:hypothetical protein